MKNRFYHVMDKLLVPFTYLAAKWLEYIRINFRRLDTCWEILKKLEIIPIRNHYYEPLISANQLWKELTEERKLIGIDLNIEVQLSYLENFNYSNELLHFPMKKGNKNNFYFQNSGFSCGDAEILYSMIRYLKPKKIIEVGSGNSTLMSLNAIRKNRQEDKEYRCDFYCIEPFEQPWLEAKKEIKVLRKKVEEVDLNFFLKLEKNDILFIDSSHVIRPQGDVLYEYQEILPALQTGVVIHIHDIFTPRDYPKEWLIDEVRLWNEQYLLEGYLTNNSEVEIICALNYLKHNYWDAISAKCPILKKHKEAEPGSFWIRKK